MPSPRALLGLTALVAILAAVMIIGGMGAAAPDGDPWPPELLANRIAVTTDDGRILTYRPDGSGERLISPDDAEGFFVWPTWSPDARRIAYSAVREDPNGETVVSLRLHDAPERASRILHEGEPGFAGLLADGVVHYPLWSPDGSNLAFVAVTRQHGLTLYLDAPNDDLPPQFALDDGPLWMSWSSDSARLLVHRGAEHFLLDPQEGPPPTKIDLDSDAYRVPAWRPNSREFHVVKEVGGSLYALYAVSDDQAGMTAERVTPARPNAAFLWSADASHIAISDDARPILYGGGVTLVYGSLRVLEAGSMDTVAGVSGNIAAFFWSPDGTRIAYATLADARGGMRWHLLDVETGAVAALADFTPSRDQFTMFQFFDQYAYSHSLWSPDGRYLAFSGRLNERAATASHGSQPAPSQIYIADTGPTRSVTALTEGVLGIWSPN